MRVYKITYRIFHKNHLVSEPGSPIWAIQYIEATSVITAQNEFKEWAEAQYSQDYFIEVDSISRHLLSCWR